MDIIVLSEIFRKFAMSAKDFVDNHLKAVFNQQIRSFLSFGSAAKINYIKRQDVIKYWSR
jgi:hypothetical protein